METMQQEAWNTPQPQFQNNKKVACGIFALLLGPFGMHKFYLGLV
jgi:TM2 domain-containing membrane protein YozV